MKPIINALSLLITSMSLAALCCYQSKAGEPVRIKSLNKESEPAMEYPKYKSIEIVALETTDDCLISNGRCITVYKDSLIFIHDSKYDNLFVFNRKGKFLSKIGNKGQGPREFISFYSFFIDNEKQCVTIIDEYRRLLLSYGFDGKFLSRKNYPENVILSSNTIIKLDNNHLLIQNKIDGENDAYQLLQLNNMKTVFKKSYYPIKTVDYMDSFSAHAMTVSEKGIDFIMPLSDTVFNCYNNKIEPKYIIEHVSKMDDVLL
jgi:hypothetical protein